MRWRSVVERAACALVLNASLAPGLGARERRVDTLAEVQRAVEVGEFARGLALAQSDTDPLNALRAEVWLRYRARDFAFAHDAAERGLRIAPGDLWLCERSLACALWLRDPPLAERALARFEAQLAAAPSADQQPFKAAVTEARLQTATLRQGAQRAHSADLRARTGAALLFIAALISLVGLGLSLHRDRPAR